MPTHSQANQRTPDRGILLIAPVRFQGLASMMLVLGQTLSALLCTPQGLGESRRPQAFGKWGSEVLCVWYTLVSCRWIQPLTMSLNDSAGSSQPQLWLPRSPWCLSLLKGFFAQGHLEKSAQLGCPQQASDSISQLWVDEAPYAYQEPTAPLQTRLLAPRMLPVSPAECGRRSPGLGGQRPGAWPKRLLLEDWVPLGRVPSPLWSQDLHLSMGIMMAVLPAPGVLEPDALRSSMGKRATSRLCLLPLPVDYWIHNQTLVTSLGSKWFAKQRQGEAQMKDSLDLGGSPPPLLLEKQNTHS